MRYYLYAFENSGGYKYAALKPGEEIPDHWTQWESISEMEYNAQVYGGSEVLP